LREKKLPAPTQDTYMFYIANRFDPHTVGRKNFKRDFGFMQGNGRKGVEYIRRRLKEVEEKNANKDVFGGTAESENKSSKSIQCIPDKTIIDRSNGGWIIPEMDNEFIKIRV
jgi:hypothetical protein